MSTRQPCERPGTAGPTCRPTRRTTTSWRTCRVRTAISRPPPHHSETVPRPSSNGGGCMATPRPPAARVAAGSASRSAGKPGRRPPARLRTVASDRDRAASRRTVPPHSGTGGRGLGAAPTEQQRRARWPEPRRDDHERTPWRLRNPRPTSKRSTASRNGSVSGGSTMTPVEFLDGGGCPGGARSGRSYRRLAENRRGTRPARHREGASSVLAPPSARRGTLQRTRAVPLSEHVSERPRSGPCDVRRLVRPEPVLSPSPVRGRPDRGRVERTPPGRTQVRDRSHTADHHRPPVRTPARCAHVGVREGAGAALFIFARRS